jgi:hypothetical protein
MRLNVGEKYRIRSTARGEKLQPEWGSYDFYGVAVDSTQVRPVDCPSNKLPRHGNMRVHTRHSVADTDKIEPLDLRYYVERATIQDNG